MTPQAAKAMFSIMRRQRDLFRDPDSAFGSSHPQDVRDAMANLLDWFITEFDK